MQDPQIKSLLSQLKQMQNRIEEESFSQEEYKELALSLGLSYTDWDKLEAAYEDFIGRTKGYIQHQLGLEALQELEQARLIRPQGEDLALFMAQAYLLCYQEKGKKTDQKAAKDWAQRQLQLNPEDQRAMQLLVQLKEEERAPFRAQNAAPNFDLAKAPQPKPINKKANGIALVILMALLAVGGLVLMPGQSHDRINQIPELVAPQVVKASESIAARWEKSNMIAGDGEIVGLSAELETIHRAEEKEFTYRLKGYFKLLSSGSGSVVAWVHYLDQNGEKLWSSPLTFDIPKGAKMGDYVAIQERHQSYGDPPPVTELLLELELVNIKDRFSPMLPKSLKLFPEKLNQKYFFKAEAMASELSYNQFSNSVYHHLSLRLKQSANSPIKKLKAKIVYLDGNGQPIDKQELLLIGPEDSPLSNRYPYIKAYQIKTALKNAEKIADYQIELLEIEE
ncbi:hypothetical protein PPO43_01920 [Saprospira sp. CCB-QB6]|uniref:hypothetical protein n=1 Tax=Saprospira sp. CCB-QB6 TaxID=3023936 RepID=UPI002349EF1C|nr:hypothetical protein [Saprospira sp. CCB-QB6]WCL81854.1 hypothetical protein PPO43_01920 [Saprospira sp. CCB-QB6]